jgi:hypothetical protein
MSVWQGVAKDSLKYHSGPPCPILLRPAGMPPPKRLVLGWPAHRAGSLRPSFTPLVTPHCTFLWSRAQKAIILNLICTLKPVVSCSESHCPQSHLHPKAKSFIYPKNYQILPL